MGETNPYRSYQFKLEIGGIVEGHFTECSGLSAKIEKIPSPEASNHQLVRLIPSPEDFSAVNLKYGVTESRALWDWLLKMTEGNVQRFNISIVLLDSQGEDEVMRWNLVDAWPSEWQGAALNASERALAIETLTLVYDRLEQSLF